MQNHAHGLGSSVKSRASAGCSRGLRLVVQGSVGGSSSSSAGSSGNSSGDRTGKQLYRRGKARQPGRFEIKVVAPPPRSLGIYALPPLTHNGEEIEVDGSGYVVTSVVVQFKLEKGKYVRDHSRLDVMPTGRWLLNQQLESLLSATYIGPTGTQD